MLRHWIIGLTLFFAATPATFAALQVAATTASMGMLAREVGGEQVRVTVLAPPDRDAHYLQARPSMIHALRRADLLLAVGAELEVGWLPVALSSAANNRILPGQPGYFEAAAQVSLLQTGQAADRAQGDTHPMGNPHVSMDPKRMATIARALAERLAQLDSAHAAEFRTRARQFSASIDTHLQRWRQSVKGAPGAVLYHKNADYLFALLDVPIHGYIETLPGIPPTAKHLKGLVTHLQNKRGIILYHSFNPADGPEFLAKQLNWPIRQLPIEPPVEATRHEYLQLIERWVTAITSVANK